MAAGSLVLRKWGDETSYPGNLAKRAELLYAFANEHRRHYHLSVPAAAKHYKSSGYKDELVWAATWVYRATGKEKYLSKVRTEPFPTTQTNIILLGTSALWRIRYEKHANGFSFQLG